MAMIEPNMPSRMYDTYGLIAPRQTHTRVATCEEVECGANINGWVTKLDVGTDVGVQRARYIIDHSGRHWTAEQNGGLVTFTFPPGQRCFAEHRVPLEREPIYTLKRGSIGSLERPTPMDSDQWIDRFANNQINLKEMIERG